MDLVKAVAGAVARGGTVEPIGLDFDGTNDYLSRSSDLVGNTDSKTFTFSCWVYYSGQSTIYSNANGRVIIQTQPDGRVYCKFSFDAVTVVYSVNSTILLPLDTWSHILISADLTNTSNRSIYINDIYDTTPYSKYVDNTINFTELSHRIGNNNNSTLLMHGRLSNLFLDYTYRDLSIEANRRLFNQIDPDRGLIPSDTVPANPILYLPMDDPDDQGRNDGTGGNFTVNGDPSQSERGANQWNASASEFDGVADGLSTTSIGATDSKTFTLSFTANLKDYSSGFFRTDTSGSYYLTFQKSADNKLDLICRNSSNTNILIAENIDISFVANRNFLLSMSVDMANQAGSKIFIDNIDTSITYVVFTNDLIGFTGNNNITISSSANGWLNGSLGDFYFDTSYIDLATDNPFWDSDTNKPKYLGEQGELPTGSQPLIYLPLRADDAGNNLGSGGDFTVNGGGLVGSRGQSEYWARSAYKAASSTLERTSMGSGLSSKTLSIVIAFQKDATGAVQCITMGSTGILNGFAVAVNVDTLCRPEVEIQNAGGTTVCRWTTTDTIDTSSPSWHTMFLSLDTQTTGNNLAVVDDTLMTTNIVTLTNDFMSLDYASTRVGDRTNQATTYSSAHVFMSTDYIDFSIEDNRRLFVDALNFPVDVQANIDAGLLPVPLIYMPFDDTSDLGKNLGSGGDFTVNGTVTSGADYNV